ncbi:H/ACA RNA-protein complex protein Gar1 [Candidatus Bathyarchaeota archaeon]|nr:H/ACA RNA-protein complex protein Gar1 [Candidatus Bathyarchaeota archaeon]
MGIVLSVTPSQNIITKSDKIPKIGIDVVDEGLKVVGKIFDIIGPTSSPYIVVRPKITDPQRLIGKKLYMILSRKKRRKR